MKGEGRAAPFVGNLRSKDNNKADSDVDICGDCAVDSNKEFKKLQSLREWQHQEAIVLLVKRGKMNMWHAFLHISLPYLSKRQHKMTKVLVTTWTYQSESFIISLYVKYVHTDPVVGYFAILYNLNKME